MDGLELRMCKGSLGDGGERIVVAEAAEIIDQLADQFRWWRDESRRAGVVAATADPVLLSPDVPRVGIQTGTCQKPRVKREEEIDGNWVSWPDLPDRRRHRLDVCKHLGGRDIRRFLSKIDSRLGAQQPSGADLQSLDARGSNAFGTKQNTSKSHGFDQRGSLSIKDSDRS